MGCSNTNKNCYAKSCVRYYNIAIQPITAGSTNVLQIAGAKVVDSGISIETQPSSYTILKKGLYRIEGDVVLNVTTAGDFIFQAYLDGVALPCTYKRITAPAGYEAIHLETDLDFDSCCCNVNKTITYVITSVETGVANVEHICTGIIKEA